MQIVQELCKRPGLNKCGFDMPTIYIPNPNKVSPLHPRHPTSASALHIPQPQSRSSSPATLPPTPSRTQPSRCVNQIEEVCRTIEKTINQTVQNTLNSLEKDCELIGEAITDTLLNDRCVSHTLCTVCMLKRRRPESLGSDSRWPHLEAKRNASAASHPHPQDDQLQ